MSRARARLPALLTALLSAAPGQALDPGLQPSQYVNTKWGAPAFSTSSVHALRQTRDGYLWIGTTTGLARFDGARFVFFDTGHTPGIPDGSVSALAEGRDGALFLGTSGGAVIRHEHGAFTPLLDRPWDRVISALYTAADGSVWVAAYGRSIHRWKEGRMRHYRPSVGATARAFAESSDGALWIGLGAEGGLMRLEGETLVPEGLRDETVQALHVDRAGTLWIGTPRGLWRRRAGRTERVVTPDGPSKDDVTALLEDRAGNLWIGTGGAGLRRLSGGRLARFTRAEGLSNDHVQQLLEDREGNLWVGTADGLNRLSDPRFVTYGRSEGLGEATVSAIAPGAHGRVWIGTTSAEVACLQEGRLTRFALPKGPYNDTVTTLAEDDDGALWVSVDNGRLFRLEDGAVRERRLRGSHEKVRLIVGGARAPLLVLAGPPTRTREDGADFLHPDVPSLGYPHAALRAADGALWLGTSIGLFRIAGEKVERWTPEQGLPSARVRSIAADGDALWLATAAGLALFERGAVRALTTKEGLPENYLRLVLDDGRGHLWLAAMGHVFRIGKEEARDVLAGRRARVSPVVFDGSDGLRSTEGLLTNGPGFRAADGRLWLATAQGVSVVDPARLAVDEPAPPVTFEEVTVDGRTGIADGAVCPPGRGEVTIAYTSPVFRAAAKMRFRHRLEGWDADWVEGEARRAHYSSLPHGAYRFQVEASNADGRWTGRPTSLAFRLEPPFHRTWKLYVLAFALALAAAVLAYRGRVARLRAQFEAVLDERTRIARELHDTLAQGLAGVGLQLDTLARTMPAVDERASERLALARAMVKSSLGEVRRSIWVLRAQSSRAPGGLAHTISESLRQITAGAGLTTTVRVAGLARPLKAEVERHLLRIAHEAVTNAVRHAEARRVDIALDFDREGLRLRVCDDGHGFEAAAHGGRDGRHFGLIGMRERASSLGGRVDIESRPGAGTRVCCFLPYAGSPDPIAADEDRTVTP